MNPIIYMKAKSDLLRNQVSLTGTKNQEKFNVLLNIVCVLNKKERSQISSVSVAARLKPWTFSDGWL